VTDARGVPIGVAVAAANTADITLLRATLRAMPVRRPKSAGRRKQHLCLDKGYIARATEKLARRLKYILHMPRKGEVPVKCQSGCRARRWVVEGSHSWTNRARRLLIRWEKKVRNYLAFLHLQFAYIALKHAGVLG
jgi:hypothetical protein